MSIATQAAHGVAWNMALGVSTRVLQLAGTLILTRFIAPDDYGTVLTASIVVMTAGALTSFAFGQYLIAKRAPAEVAAQAMVVYVGLGVVAMAVLYALRGPIGDLVDAPGMGQYVLGFAIANVIDRTRYVPERLVMRALRFRALATINGLGELTFTAAALSTAGAFGAYAIMFGTLARSVITAILFLRAAPRAEWLVRPRLRAADVRDLISFGLPMMIAIVAERAATRWDNLIMSRLFDTGVMGRYNLAYSLAEMPIINVADHIGDVLMPSFSRMEDDQRPRAAIRAAELMGLIVSPLGVGLGAVAPTVVATLFDPRWAAMAPMLAILSVMTVFRPMIWSAIAYAQAVQKTRVVMLSSFLLAVIVLPLVAVCGAAGGPTWACIGAGIGYAVHATLTIVMASRATGLPIGAYLRAAARPLLPCVPMFLAVTGLERALAAAGIPLVVSLAAQILSGAVVYIGAAFVLVRPGVDELVRIGRDALRRRHGGPDT
jgi:PST family polysaccharide transporter